ncbi:hypothetical protein [Serratia fonticola]|uniref:hypothetical protein n=1 Tax=Serratia fonticola TaxID=47917 RepID=UPI0024DE62DC|nr:hypothetical protein [Serratia fonticola]MDK2377296.1 hypothetical protein [Serratia fonticola]
MSHEITLDKTAQKAEQANVICLLLESYPHRMDDSEVTAIAALLARLTGEVATWLLEEQSRLMADEAAQRETSGVLRGSHA